MILDSIKRVVFFAQIVLFGISSLAFANALKCGDKAILDSLKVEFSREIQGAILEGTEEFATENMLENIDTENTDKDKLQDILQTWQNILNTKEGKKAATDFAKNLFANIEFNRITTNTSDSKTLTCTAYLQSYDISRETIRKFVSFMITTSIKDLNGKQILQDKDTLIKSLADTMTDTFISFFEAAKAIPINYSAKIGDDKRLIVKWLD